MTIDTVQQTGTITWNSLPGRNYTLHDSHDLISWQELEDSIPSEGLTTDQELFDLPAGDTRHFYRVKGVAN